MVAFRVSDPFRPDDDLEVHRQQIDIDKVWTKPHHARSVHEIAMQADKHNVNNRRGESGIFAVDTRALKVDMAAFCD